ncbi:polyprenyl synthetase family protein [Streptosporangium sp. NBC_01755]|uniref:polyprenyl synthetase family protein n=1 Tax=unclassified Streptosporangium TaxID=2632669 RepID=UPI002DD7CB72|nr:MULTISPECIES: polyprenyl synthetase family protein [unclassified Streptosporangium]WSA24655.1 polyprenyl synthetase family protein [Streptosporangium sp. NBC_01810]WSC97269.1 polyprenyl synthetase family protein [Streptosporangium sp. NBC_01755]
MTAVIPPSVTAARELVEPVLRDAVARLDPLTSRVAAYHLGWADPAGLPVASGGKALRPALAMLSARAAGGNAEQGLPVAAAVELVHAFSLLHDDIMDGDRMRRHRPAAWTVFGCSAAILAGDALLSLAAELLLDGDGLPCLRAARHLAVATRELIAGQALDLEFEQLAEVSLAECRRMSTQKTGSLLACACSIGATVMNGPAPLIAGLTAFGTQAGLAFQLVDDLLGIWGSPETTGKPVLSDLRARKKSLPIVAALTSDTPAGRRLARLLAAPEPLSESDLHDAARLVEEAGGRSWAETEAKHRLDVAEHHLAGADMPPDVRAEFLDIVRFLTSRGH